MPKPLVHMLRPLARMFCGLMLDGRVSWTICWDAVTCPECLKQRPL